MICHILPLCVGRVMNSAERPSSSSTPDRGAWITCRHGELLDAHTSSSTRSVTGLTGARRPQRIPSPREAGDGRPPQRLGSGRSTAGSTSGSDQSKVPL